MALPELFANSSTPGSPVAVTTLAAAVTSTTAITITTAAAAPVALQAAGQFRITIDSEIMIVTGGANTTTWTVTRGAESSTAATHLINTSIWHRLTAGALGGQSDAAAGVPSLRTLGSSATQAAPGTGSGVYAPLASPTFTGAPAAPTAAVNTNTTQVATTAYVMGQGYAPLASPSFTGTISGSGALSVTGSGSYTLGNNTTSSTVLFNSLPLFPLNTSSGNPSGTSNVGYGGITWNNSAGNGEVNFWNFYSLATNVAFTWRLATSTTASTQLMSLGTGGTLTTAGQIGYAASKNENGVNVQSSLASGYASSLYFCHSSMVSGTGYNLFWGENSTGAMFVARGDGQLLARFASISVLSDKALKKNVADLPNGLDVVCALRPRSFDWRDKSRGSDIGFIAQEVEPHVPHLVDRHVKRRGGKEYKTFAQGGLVPYLVGAVKELAERVESLEDRLASVG